MRPIAVGEGWRRLVGKYLCEKVKDGALHLLWPYQIDEARPLGSEIGSRALRQWMEKNDSSPVKVAFIIDFANSFNTIDRDAFLRAARLHLPRITPFIE